MVTSVGYVLIRVRLELLHAVLDDVLEGLQTSHHPGHSAVLIQFQNEIRFVPHNELEEMFKKGIRTTAEIGHMQAKKVGPALDKLFTAGRKLNGLSDNDIDELAGNSEPTQKDSSNTD